ncbi:hypothetical protein C8R46DRAFT_1223526 [Mycena filopes]|nr:hypothetical protein C8R46DRAFT_1223526 [Mycena filopes]
MAVPLQPALSLPPALLPIFDTAPRLTPNLCPTLKTLENSLKANVTDFNAAVPVPPTLSPRLGPTSCTFTPELSLQLTILAGISLSSLGLNVVELSDPYLGPTFEALTSMLPLYYLHRYSVQRGLTPCNFAFELSSKLAVWRDLYWVIGSGGNSGSKTLQLAVSDRIVDADSKALKALAPPSPECMVGLGGSKIPGSHCKARIHTRVVSWAQNLSPCLFKVVNQVELNITYLGLDLLDLRPQVSTSESDRGFARELKPPHFSSNIGIIIPGTQNLDSRRAWFEYSRVDVARRAGLLWVVQGSPHLRTFNPELSRNTVQFRRGFKYQVMQWVNRSILLSRCRSHGQLLDPRRRVDFIYEHRPDAWPSTPRLEPSPS